MTNVLSNLIFSSIGIKNSFDIITTSFGLLSKTTKAIVRTNNHNKIDVAEFILSSDIVFKIDVIEGHLIEINSNKNSTKLLIEVIEGLNNTLSLIKNEMINLNESMQYNKNSFLGFRKKDTDKSIILLEKLLKILDSRFILLKQISQ